MVQGTSGVGENGGVWRTAFQMMRAELAQALSKPPKRTRTFDAPIPKTVTWIREQLKAVSNVGVDHLA
jgi:hypothetical protein